MCVTRPSHMPALCLITRIYIQLTSHISAIFVSNHLLRERHWEFIAVKIKLLRKPKCFYAHTATEVLPLGGVLEFTRCINMLKHHQNLFSNVTMWAVDKHFQVNWLLKNTKPAMYSSNKLLLQLLLFEPDRRSFLLRQIEAWLRVYFCTHFNENYFYQPALPQNGSNRQYDWVMGKNCIK